MKILVTGATGFVGQSLIPTLLMNGHSVMATSLDPEKAKKMNWFKHVKYVNCNLYSEPELLLDGSFQPDALIHLAWAGLDNFADLRHIVKYMPSDINFIQSMINHGVKHILITGTCLEYGNRYGELSEDMPTYPIIAYGIAKDTVRKSLEILQSQIPFKLQWIRLFYMYGPNQSPNSLISKLNHAIYNGEDTFSISRGDQLRDYLYIGDVVKKLEWIVSHSECDGIINCCSGNPISVYDLVKRHACSMNSSIIFRRNVYNIPKYESLAFWGSSFKLNNYMKTYCDDNEL